MLNAHLLQGNTKESTELGPDLRGVPEIMGALDAIWKPLGVKAAGQSRTKWIVYFSHASRSFSVNDVADIPECATSLISQKM